LSQCTSNVEVPAQATRKAITKANVALEGDLNAGVTSLEGDLNTAVPTILQQLQTGAIDVPTLASAIATNPGPNMGNELATALKNAQSRRSLAGLVSKPR
jgi:hypothetical protein